MNWLSAIALVVIVTVFIAILCGIPVYFLWNALIPALFGLSKVTFWQAVGLSLLCSCLFKSSTTVNGKD